MGTLIAVIAIVLIGGFLIAGFVGFSIFEADTKSQKNAIENQETVLKDFFDGAQTKVYTHSGGGLPIANMIENAHRFGYRLSSQSESNYITTLVFERV